MTYDFATLPEHFTSFRTLELMEIDYQAIFDYLHCGKCPAGTCVNQKRATVNKTKKFVIKDGVLHYIAKEWMHIHNCFQKKEMQLFPLTRTASHH